MLRKLLKRLSGAMAAGGEFVEGWLVAQVLGEGAYGEVRLLVHSRSGACVALKAVQAGEGGAREAALHRALRHPHVLRCLGERRHHSLHYLFLEYAQGGELFDRIEPDSGMRPRDARRYWRQLTAGLAYLHARGVAHRDIKPENLLLDHEDNLKISDFGMATLFRHGSRERLLSRVCGTVPYAAPEVLRAERRPYRAPPADLWAAALVLLAMLAGELPWERASEDDPRYAAWHAWCAAPGTSSAPAGVWRKLGAGALALLRRALQPDASRRATLDMLLADRWLAQSDTKPDHQRDGTRRVWCSQPLPGASSAGDTRRVEGGTPGAPDLSAADIDALLCYSQPAHADDLLLSTPPDTPGAPPAPPGMLQRLVRRMTRVWLRCDDAAALRALAALLDQQRYTWRRIHPRIFAIDCGDDVRMRAWALPVGGGGEGDARSVLEFRRSRGCGLAFKRRYLQLRRALLAAAPGAAPPPAAHALAAPLDALAPTPTPAGPDEPMDMDHA
ncbi:unnamed protein product, partial [Brenthis ino]